MISLLSQSRTNAHLNSLSIVLSEAW